MVRARMHLTLRTRQAIIPDTMLKAAITEVNAVCCLTTDASSTYAHGLLPIRLPSLEWKYAVMLIGQRFSA